MRYATEGSFPLNCSNAITVYLQYCPDTCTGTLVGLCTAIKSSVSPTTCNTGDHIILGKIFLEKSVQGSLKASLLCSSFCMRCATACIQEMSGDLKGMLLAYDCSFHFISIKTHASSSAGPARNMAQSTIFNQFGPVLSHLYQLWRMRTSLLVAAQLKFSRQPAEGLAAGRAHQIIDAKVPRTVLGTPG